MNLLSVIRRSWLIFRGRVGLSPFRVKLLGALIPKWRKGLVTSEHEICVEGYPRCANTYTIALLIQSKHGTLNYASHTHWAGNALLARKLGVPVLLLIRDPKECVASHAVFEPDVPLRVHLLDYINFYRVLLPFRNEFLVVDFNEVISNHQLILNRMREFTGKDYREVDLSNPEIKRSVDSLVEKWHYGRHRAVHEDPEQTIARPSDVREHRKLDVVKRIKHDPELVILMDWAKSLYDVFKEN